MNERPFVGTLISACHEVFWRRKRGSSWLPDASKARRLAAFFLHVGELNSPRAFSAKKMPPSPRAASVLSSFTSPIYDIEPGTGDGNSMT